LQTDTLWHTILPISVAKPSNCCCQSYKKISNDLDTNARLGRGGNQREYRHLVFRRVPQQQSVPFTRHRQCPLAHLIYCQPSSKVRAYTRRISSFLRQAPRSCRPHVLLRQRRIRPWPTGGKLERREPARVCQCRPQSPSPNEEARFELCDRALCRGAEWCGEGRKT